MSEYSDPPSDVYYDSDDSGGFEDFQDDDSDYSIPVDTGKSKEKVGGIEHRSLSVEKLQSTLEDDIRRVANIIGLEHPVVSILLQHFRWNEDNLLERFMDNPTSVLRDAGEPPEDESMNSRPVKRIKLTPSQFVCGICFDEPAEEDIAKLRCGHSFCAECWKSYCSHKIMEEGECLFRCMAEGCKTAVDRPFLARLVDPTCFNRYKELLRRSYVTSNPNYRYCPYPSCSETVYCTGGRGSSLLQEVPIVKCGQGHAFCFGCGLDDDHRPCICKYVAMWLKNARDDAGTSQWMRANTRPCPKCQNNIEKSGGCNRILCTHCSFEFCWLCLKKWSVHGYAGNETCTAWKEPVKDENMTSAQRNLEKWLHYFDRFNNHEISANLDQSLCARTEDKMMEFQQASQLSWIESKFLEQAVDELTTCRVALKWSYAMAYFLQSGNQKQMFEDLQVNLEAAVEELSEMLQEDIVADTVKSLRQRMMDKTIYVRQRRETLLNDTAAGLLEGRWEWLES
ncbi:hypothetical protein K474DRAFT_1682029 [Panus rudis PR-1116 ss-1]|nr:hypothetical protein K474DRAFT_1682029 [Panus rudis PR-1116 ss-1]